MIVISAQNPYNPFGFDLDSSNNLLVIGRRLIPHVLHWVVHTGSRELFRLAVLAIAIGIAGQVLWVHLGWWVDAYDWTPP